jgi:hypothetical protein
LLTGQSTLLRPIDGDKYLIGGMYMDDLINEVSDCLNRGRLAVGLIGLFTIPDSAAAIEYGPVNSGDRYALWFNTFIECSRAGLNGKLAWSLRNALMHETAMNWREKGFAFDRVIITMPNNSGAEFHSNVVQARGSDSLVLQLSLQPLAQAILDGAGAWLKGSREDAVKAERMAGIMQYRPHGLPPWVIGMPSVA